MSDIPTILVVDDNQDLLETFAMILKRRGFSVETAADGAAAVDKFREQTFDVTLMDVVMPEMNGVEALKKIRELEPGAPVFLMTAYSDEELIETARIAGVNDVISKPIRIDQLMSLIMAAAGTGPILVVDDDTDIRETLARVLELDGNDVVSAASGEEAVALAARQPCRLAFIDVKLPNIDGLETFLRLKEMNPNLPTVMMTGFRNEVREALERAQQSAGVTCLYKPFDPAAAADIARKLSPGGRRSRRKHGAA